MPSSPRHQPEPPQRSDGPPFKQPFVDPARIPALYADPDRIHRRSGALLRAKVRGLHVGETAAALLGRAVPSLHLRSVDEPALIADIGCGQGRPTRTLAKRFPMTHVLAIDASEPMLTQARTLLNPQSPPLATRPPVALLAGDFHQLPLTDGILSAATAVFCLYHSPTPARVVGEIARVLSRNAAAALISKSTDSYRELDLLLADSGLDPDAAHRPSLYEAASGETLPELAATALTVETVLHDQHVFEFHNATHLAEYLVTVPKFDLPARLSTDPATLAAHLRRRRGDGPVQTTSTITYVIARRTS